MVIKRIQVRFQDGFTREVEVPGEWSVGTLIAALRARFETKLVAIHGIGVRYQLQNSDTGGKLPDESNIDSIGIADGKTLLLMPAAHGLPGRDQVRSSSTPLESPIGPAAPAKTSLQEGNHTVQARRCPQCGNFRSPDANFCSRCGSPFDRAIEVEAESESEFTLDLDRLRSRLQEMGPLWQADRLRQAEEMASRVGQEMECALEMGIERGLEAVNRAVFQTQGTLVVWEPLLPGEEGEQQEEDAQESSGYGSVSALDNSFLARLDWDTDGKAITLVVELGWDEAGLRLSVNGTSVALSESDYHRALIAALQEQIGKPPMH